MINAELVTKEKIIDYINEEIKGACDEVIDWLLKRNPKVKPLIWHETAYGFCSEKGYYSIKPTDFGDYQSFYDGTELPGNHPALKNAKAQCQHFYEEDILSQVDYE